MVNAIWRIVESDRPLCDPYLITGGIVHAPSLMIRYRKDKSAISTQDLLPPDGWSPADYVTEVSKQLIASAGRVNTLLNIVQDFREGAPGGRALIPPRLRIEIGGHTDKVGAAAYNIKLSKARAQGVVDFLKKTTTTAAIVAFSGHADAKDLISERLKPVGHGPKECVTADGIDNPEARKVTFRIVDESAG